MAENKTEEVEEAETEVDAEAAANLLATIMDPGPSEPRVIGVFGDIDEERTANTCAALIAFSQLSTDPIEVILSTNGGSADEMYAIVDTMGILKAQNIEISVTGVGKIFSAGVLILASGTKGQRKVGKNTRLMLHPLQGGTQGPLWSMKDDVSSMQKIQKSYIDAMAEVTSMTHKELRRIVNKRSDTYFTAQEALEMGIVDEVL